MATNWNAVLANINNASDILAILRKVLGLLDGKVDLTKIDEIITDISDMQTNVDSALVNVTSALAEFDTDSKEAIEQVIAAGLMEGFATEAELLASRPTILKKYAKAEDTDVIWFWNKPEGSPDGNYWTSTGLSELVRAKKYTDDQVVNTKDFTGKKIVQLSSTMGGLLLQKNPDTMIPIITGDNNNVVLYYSAKNQKLIGLGLQEKDFAQAYATAAGTKVYVGEGDIVPFFTDMNNNIMLGYSKSQRKLVGLFDSPDDNLTNIFDWNHFIFYGQSLSIGAQGTPVLSSIQKFHNIGFTGGSQPTGFTAIAPLVEGPTESPVSGAANYAVYRLGAENGVDPANYVVFGSTAGIGSQTLAQLAKGTGAYTAMLNHIQQAKVLADAVGKSYAVQAMGWLQGEENLRLEVDLATYQADLAAHIQNVKTDTKAITGQTFDPKFISYQLSTRIGVSDAVCKAQLELCKSGQLAIATPTYLFPYYSDNVHLTNISYKWIGSYFGRAYKQWVIDGKFPDWLEPLSATIVGNKVTVNFKVPKAPLVLDTTFLASTPNSGFAVKQGSTLLGISGVVANSTSVEITLTSTPTGPVTVRYGLDYLAPTLTIIDGKSGNLRDSTPDTVVIDGLTKPMFHICPHFELNVLNGEF